MLTSHVNVKTVVAGKARLAPITALRHRMDAVRTKASNFDTWSRVLESRPPAAAAVVDPSLNSKLAKAVAEAAKSYTPVQPPNFHFELPASLLTADYHQVLEDSAVAQLKGWLGMTLQQPLNAQLMHFTTTDVDAALQIAGVTVDGKGGSKDAVLVLVAAETQRQMSWSRLESLIMHFAVAPAPGGKWEMPNAGWKSFPDQREDAGGAWQCHFEKLTLPGGNNEHMYTLIVQMPLTGPLATGGLTFVLKAASGSQGTRWLKDSGSGSDFFLDLKALPLVAK